MKLSEAILKGCNLSTQIKFLYNNDNGGTCALGAAILGANLNHKAGFYDFVEMLNKAFPILIETTKHPVEKTPYSVHYAIVNLNDMHGWSRERIATWLANEVEEKESVKNIEKELVLSH